MTASSEPMALTTLLDRPCTTATLRGKYVHILTALASKNPVDRRSAGSELEHLTPTVLAHLYDEGHLAFVGHTGEHSALPRYIWIED